MTASLKHTTILCLALVLNTTTHQCVGAPIISSNSVTKPTVETSPNPSMSQSHTPPVVLSSSVLPTLSVNTSTQRPTALPSVKSSALAHMQIIKKNSKKTTSKLSNVLNNKMSKNITRTNKEIEKAVRWLEQFGYLSESLNSGEVVPPSQDMKKALRKMQRYAQLPVTGVLDDATIAQMNKPRCGDKDFYPAGTTRVKRYILLRMRWQRGRQIDIQFRNHTPDMSVDEQEAIMKDVVDEWNAAANTNLVFHPNGQQVQHAEINIHHTRYDYLGRPFLPYGVLAYAALPRNGDMFFDDTESWAEYHRFRPPYSFSYKTVALHELGHSLGFAHSNVPSAVMYAFYGPTRHTLTDDDIAGAIDMFGVAK